MKPLIFAPRDGFGWLNLRPLRILKIETG